MNKLIKTTHLWLFGIFFLFAGSNSIANHADISPACPDVEINGGESIDFWFEDYYTQKPYQSGQTIPAGTQMNHYQHAEAYGSCDINIWDPANNICVNAHYEREIFYTIRDKYEPSIDMWSTNKMFAGRSWDDCRTGSHHIFESGVTPCTAPSRLFFTNPGRHLIKNNVVVVPTPCEFENPALVGPVAHFDVIKPLKCLNDNAVGNPCSTSTGNKHQREDDYNGSNLPFVRYYNSLFTVDVGLGYGWTTPYHKRLAIGSGSSGDIIIIIRSNGRSEKFTQQTNGSFVGDAGTSFTLTETANGYVLTDTNANTETYNTGGLILTEADAAGNATTYSYNTNNKLETVTGPYGHQLTFTYDTDGTQIETVTLPDGKVLQYAYAVAGNDEAHNLVMITYPDTTTKTYHYENSSFPHHLTGITDQSNMRFATWEYDTSGRAIRSEHAETTNGAPQEQFLLTYDSYLQTTVTVPNGNQEVYKFNWPSLGRKTLKEKLNLADNKSLKQTFSYPANNLTSRTDEEGNKTTYIYNATNQRLSMTEAVGTTEARTTNYTYYSNAVDLVTTITQPSVASSQSVVTTVSYNGDLRPDNITRSGFEPNGSPISRTATLSYNSQGQVIAIDGSRTDVSDITTFTYYTCTSGGECGQLASITNALNQTTTYNSYDAAGRVKTMTDTMGVTITYTYDYHGRVVEIKQTPPAGAIRITSYSYNAIGKLASVTTPIGITLTYSYDAAHDLSSVTDNLGNKVEYKYDLSGNRTEEVVKDSGGTLVHTIQKTYDVRDNLATINNGGSLTQLVHDAVGRLVSNTDANNHETTNSYNALHELTSIVDALTNPTTYEYDIHSNNASALSPNGATTLYTYDDLGNLLSEVSPDRGTLTYTHDAAGNVLSQTDARGVTVTMTYDALNRILTKDYPGTEEDVVYSYDTCLNGVGQLCSVQDQSGTTTYAYDAFGNIVERTQTVLGVNYTTWFTYNADNQLTQMTYPTGHVIDYSRDTLGRISATNVTVNGQTTAVVTNMTYTADGLIANQTFGNGLLETRSHDAQRRLTAWQIGGIFNRTYAYDPAGNLISRSLDTGSQTFAYDAVDRLLTDAGIGTNHTFTYDANGNRLTAQGSGSQVQYSYESSSNRLSGLGSATVILDAAGNTIMQGGLDMTYNQANRLAMVTEMSVDTGPFTYNADGLRTTKVTPNGTTVFHYDLNGLLLAETTGAGTHIRIYIWAESTPVAQMDTDLINLHVDHLNTPRVATNSNGNIVWQWDSDAFGSMMPNEDPNSDGTMTTVNLRFPGQYFDQETGLHYNYFRDYDPETGRYISSDPIGLAGGLNTYGYALQSPLSFVDPFGLRTIGRRTNEALGNLPDPRVEMLNEAPRIWPDNRRSPSTRILICPPPEFEGCISPPEDAVPDHFNPGCYLRIIDGPVIQNPR